MKIWVYQMHNDFTRETYEVEVDDEMKAYEVFNQISRNLNTMCNNHEIIDYEVEMQDEGDN